MKIEDLVAVFTIINVMVSVYLDIRRGHNKIDLTIVNSVASPLISYYIFLNALYRGSNSLIIVSCILLASNCLFMLLKVSFEITKKINKCKMANYFEIERFIFSQFNKEFPEDSIKLHSEEGTITGKDLIKVLYLIKDTYFNLLLITADGMKCLNYDISNGTTLDSEYCIEFMQIDLAVKELNENSNYKFRVVHSASGIASALVLVVDNLISETTGISIVA